METNIKLADEALCRIEQLVADLSSKKLSSYGKEVLIERLSACINECRSAFNTVVDMIQALSSKYSLLEESIIKPQKLENEFKDVAKKLNFPDLSPVSDGSVTNPNIELPFEDPVPKADIDFIKERLEESNKKPIVLSKEEQLTKKEIKAYTNEQEINKLAKEELKSLEKLDTFSVSSAVRQKRKMSKDKSKKSKKFKKMLDD